MEQKVSPYKLKPWQGVLVVIGAAVLLFVVQFVLSFLQYAVSYYAFRSGNPIGETAYTVASVLYWVVGGVVALAFLRHFILSYQYTANTRQLRIERVYGEGRPRFVEDVYLNRLLAMDSFEALHAKYPDAKRINACIRRCTYPRVSVAYKTADGVRILCFQPNGDFRRLLEDSLRA